MPIDPETRREINRAQIAKESAAQAKKQSTKKEPEFTGPAKYSPFVPPTPVKNFTPTVFPTVKPSGSFIGPIPLGTTRTATGYVPEVASGSTYSPGDFRKAEEKSNEPFYQSQQQEPILNFGAGSFSLKVSATPPTPTLPATVSPPPPPVKTATLDIILFDEESIPTDGMFDQIFENIGGQELISITRSDIVNGQKISYQPIKNLSAIQQRYNPNNILSLQQTADKFFAGFSIKLEDKTPQIGNGPNGENVYLNATGDLIIEFININADEQIETQISVSGTIYEADLGDYTS
jgi:hypothetical protein